MENTNSELVLIGGTVAADEIEYDECIINVEVGALSGVKITASERITVNGTEVRNVGGWSLKDIIRCAAHLPSGSAGVGYATWHDVIYAETFEQTGENAFYVGFGS